MRNWHQEIIKLPQAISKIPLRTPINIGVMEGYIEYEMLNSVDVFGFNYQAVNEGLRDTTRKKVLCFSPSSPVSPVLNNLKSSAHATSVSGVIAANKNINNVILPIEGVLSESSIFNFNNRMVNLLINSGIVWDIYENNRIALNSRDINLKLENRYLGLYPYTFDSNFSPNQASASVINSSVSYNIDYWKGNTNAETKNLQDSFKHFFKTILAYSRHGRGTLICLAAGNNNKNTKDEQYLSNYNYPFIVAASGLTNGTTLANSIEIRSSYSSFGEQIDICAPSSGGIDSNNVQYKRRIFTTTNKFCGDIGTKDEVYTYTIASVIGNDKISLNSTNGLFAGNALELGISSSNEYDVMIIKDVDRLNKIVTFTESRFFTLNTTLLNTTVRAAVLKNKGVLNANRIIVNNPKGLGFVGQKFYIGDNQIGHFATITSVINANTFEFNPQISVNLILPTNYDIIPDQIVLSIQSHNLVKGSSSDYTFQIKPVDSTKLKSLFEGELTLLTGQYNDGTTIVDVEFRENIIKIDFAKNEVTIEKLNLQDITITEIKTIGYGSYTSSFGGTSSASPLLAGVAGLLLQANSDLNVFELKHILKSTADKIDTSTRSYSMENNMTKKNYGYNVNNNLGAGRVNAEAAVQLALDWHSSSPSQTVLKPRLEIADKLNGTAIAIVPDGDVVDSPDIWVNEVGKTPTVPTPTNLLNTINTLKDQTIYVKVRNTTGTRDSFKECDLRVFVAFTDEVNPAFDFPTKWYDQAEVKLLSVIEIPIIPAGGEKTIEIEWKDIAAFWETYNPLPTQNGVLVPNGLRKRAYILAHIAPFDGKADDVRTDNIRHNKQLSCKELIVTHRGNNNRTTYIPGNGLNITVGTDLVDKSFDLRMENVLATELDTLSIKASRKNRADQVIEEVLYKKTGNGWALESGSPDWITFETPTESASIHNNYKHAVFPHKLTINEEEEEIKLEIINA
jgi:subtilisin family serine protease